MHSFPMIAADDVLLIVRERQEGCNQLVNRMILHDVESFIFSTAGHFVFMLAEVIKRLSDVCDTTLQCQLNPEKAVTAGSELLDLVPINRRQHLPFKEDCRSITDGIITQEILLDKITASHRKVPFPSEILITRDGISFAIHPLAVTKGQYGIFLFELLH